VAVVHGSILQTPQGGIRWSADSSSG
jgi:hypothetical protein